MAPIKLNSCRKNEKRRPKYDISKGKVATPTMVKVDIKVANKSGLAPMFKRAPAIGNAIGPGIVSSAPTIETKANPQKPCVVNSDTKLSSGTTAKTNPIEKIIQKRPNERFLNEVRLFFRLSNVRVLSFLKDTEKTMSATSQRNNCIKILLNREAFHTPLNFFISQVTACKSENESLLGQAASVMYLSWIVDSGVTRI